MIHGRRKRLYRRVAVVPLDGGFGVALDGKPVTTPAKAPLVLPTRPLAEAVAAEWAAQGPEFDPLAMPLTRLAGSAIDLVRPGRAEVIASTAAYSSTDLLCYRADGPPELVARQQASWQPVLDWAALRYNAPLRVTAGVIAIDQPPAALEALHLAVAACDDMRLTAVAAATAACGSLVLALALAEGRIDAEAAAALCHLDEAYQSELWGEDEEAARRREAQRAEIATAARFLALLAAGAAVDSNTSLR